MEKSLKCILFAALISITTQSKANQAYAEFSIDNNIKVAVTKKENIYRIGNAILVKTATISESKSWTSWILAACDKSWISTDTNLTINYKKTAENFSQLLFDDKPEKRIHANRVVIIPVEKEKKQSMVKNWIIQNAPKLCKTAKKNLRNFSILVSQSYNGKEGSGISSSILLETSLIKAGIVSAWFRYSHYSNIPIYSSSGEQVEFNGTPIFDEELSDKYYMGKSHFNCKKRLSAISNYIEYEKEGSESKDLLGGEKMPIFSSIIPGSIGEAELEFACSLYGKK